MPDAVLGKGIQEQDRVNIPLLCAPFNFVSQKRLIDLAVMSSIDRKHLFLFLRFFVFGSQRLTLCRYFSLDTWVGDLSEKSVRWALPTFSFCDLGQCFGRAHLSPSLAQEQGLEVETFIELPKVLSNHSWNPPGNSLSGGTFARRIIMVILFLPQCVLICHCIGPLGFLFWGERFRNIVFSPWSIEPNWWIPKLNFGTGSF